MHSKLAQLAKRMTEIDALLSREDAARDMDSFRALGRERAEIEPVVAGFHDYNRAQADLLAAQEMLADPDMKVLAEEEIHAAKARIEALEDELQRLLLPKDPNLGGYKEVIVRIEGAGAYSKLKFESGGHRVQRVPETEAQGRIHTSAATVAVLPEADEVADVKIDPAELRIDVFRASGAGGQHVQKTESAVRITHLPTGLVVECQDERSQHKNRERAMKVLAARLMDRQTREQQAKEASQRKSLIGSGDRSERIRTYNFPQGRVTDHRINLTLYKIDQIMDGDLSELTAALSAEHQAELLATLGETA